MAKIAVSLMIDYIEEEQLLSHTQKDFLSQVNAHDDQPVTVYSLIPPAIVISVG